jgi:chromosome segregation ATPase
MSTEDRVLRLENAFATLVELAAEQNRRMSDQQRRVERIEESFVALIELTRSHHDGIEELKAAQTDTERRIGALADAQIRSEERVTGLTDAMQRLTDAMQRLADAMQRLADAQTHTDQRLDALIDIVRDSRGGQSQ